jgi:hypothetical protein
VADADLLQNAAVGFIRALLIIEDLVIFLNSRGFGVTSTQQRCRRKEIRDQGVASAMPQTAGEEEALAARSWVYIHSG